MKTPLPALILLSLLLSGCHTAQYGVNVKNLTPTVLKDVRIVFPGHTFAVDELITDQKYPAHFLSFPVAGPIPRTGAIEFRTPDKAVHSVHFKVPRLQSTGTNSAVYCFIKIHSNEEVSVEQWHHEHLFYEKTDP